MESLRTGGSWSTEEEAAAAFDAAVAGDPRFGTIYPEVTGRYVAQSPFDIERTPRIDRVLMPSPRLIAAGWCSGPIGVEIKAPGAKLGVAIAQCLDYCRATFELRPGFFSYLGFVFIFSAEPESGTIASIMAQQRIGTAVIGYDGTLRFKRDRAQKLSLEEPDRNFIPRRKVGSR